VQYIICTLHINKENVFCDFEKLSNMWETSSNIAICLDVEQTDIGPIVKELLGKLPNDLAYCIMSTPVRDKDLLRKVPIA